MDRQLHALGLERYEPALLDEGFESSQDLRNATMEDYLAVGLKIGHARRLVTAMAQDQVAIDAGEDTGETAAKTDAGESVVTDTKKDYIAVDTKSGHARGPSHPGHQALVAIDAGEETVETAAKMNAEEGMAKITPSPLKWKFEWGPNRHQPTLVIIDIAEEAERVAEEAERDANKRAWEAERAAERAHEESVNASVAWEAKRDRLKRERTMDDIRSTAKRERALRDNRLQFMACLIGALLGFLHRHDVHHPASVASSAPGRIYENDYAKESGDHTVSLATAPSFLDASHGVASSAPGRIYENDYAKESGDHTVSLATAPSFLDAYHGPTHSGGPQDRRHKPAQEFSPNGSPRMTSDSAQHDSTLENALVPQDEREARNPGAANGTNNDANSIGPAKHPPEQTSSTPTAHSAEQNAALPIAASTTTQSAPTSAPNADTSAPTAPPSTAAPTASPTTPATVPRPAPPSSESTTAPPPPKAASNEVPSVSAQAASPSTSAPTASPTEPTVPSAPPETPAPAATQPTTRNLSALAVCPHCRWTGSPANNLADRAARRTTA